MNIEKAIKEKIKSIDIDIKKINKKIKKHSEQIPEKGIILTTNGFEEFDETPTYLLKKALLHSEKAGIIILKYELTNLLEELL